jgi:hypothetical protein
MVARDYENVAPVTSKREVRRDSDVASMQDVNLDGILSIEKYLFMQQRYDISSERQIISVFLYHYKKLHTVTG